MNIGLLHCYDSETILSGQMALFFRSGVQHYNRHIRYK